MHQTFNKKGGNTKGMHLLGFFHVKESPTHLQSLWFYKVDSKCMSVRNPCMFVMFVIILYLEIILSFIASVDFYDFSLELN